MHQTPVLPARCVRAFDFPFLIEVTMGSIVTSVTMTSVILGDFNKSFQMLREECNLVSFYKLVYVTFLNKSVACTQCQRSSSFHCFFFFFNNVVSNVFEYFILKWEDISSVSVT